MVFCKAFSHQAPGQKYQAFEPPQRWPGTAAVKVQ